MPETVDHQKALEILNQSWGERESKTHPPPMMQLLIDQVLEAKDITFKYILITGYLAKLANPSVHARALQVSSRLVGAYDARSLCHDIIVGFEKSKGNLFGLSNEPFVNKPARHPEHDGANPQLRNKALAQILHEALELANSAKPEEVYLGLVQIMRLSSRRATERKEIIVRTQVNLQSVQQFIKEFLKETDGGSRLVGVWGALLGLLSEGGLVKVVSPNASDEFGKTAGDVEIYYDGALVASSECKHRPLNLDDVKHGIRKAHEKHVPEYHFVIAAGLAPLQEESIMTELESHSDEVDLYLVNIWDSIDLLSGVLNPIRRAKFGEKVVDLMIAMRKFDSANFATELWNAIIG